MGIFTCLNLAAYENVFFKKRPHKKYFSSSVLCYSLLAPEDSIILPCIRLAASVVASLLGGYRHGLKNNSCTTKCYIYAIIFFIKK